MVKSLLFLLSILFCCPFLYADTIYLKNGHTVTGLIKTRGEKGLELEVCSGTVEFSNSEIDRIVLSPPEENQAIRSNWEAQEKDRKQMMAQHKAQEAKKPKETQFSTSDKGIIVSARLNKKADVSLVLDTGATLVTLRKSVAERLGIDLNKIPQEATLNLADGRQVKAKYVVLESVEVENVEAKNVEAVILLEESADFRFHDGLLGMSFLKRFNFKVNQKEKRLVLEKI